MIRIKKLLNRAIALNGNKVTLSCLNTLLEPESPLANEPTLIDARQNALDKKIREQTISNGDAALEQSQINAALQSLVDTLEESDVKAEEIDIMEHLVDVVELIDEERRIEDGNQKKPWPIPAPLMYAAIVGLSVLTFAVGIFSSSALLGAGESDGVIGCEEVEAEVDSLKNLQQQNATVLLETKAQVKACQDSIAFFKGQNEILAAGASGGTQVLLEKENKILSLRRQLNDKKDDLAKCINDLANASTTTAPPPSNRGCSAGRARISLHCRTSDWDASAIRKIRTKLESIGHTVTHSSAGAGGKEKFTIEYKRGSSDARAIAHCIMEKLSTDYCLEGVNFISDPKAIAIFLP